MSSEERSLAAAMRWQDELTSRGCLPSTDRAPSPLLASLDPNQLSLLQRSDSKLLAAAAAAAAAAAQARPMGLSGKSVPATPPKDTAHSNAVQATPQQLGPVSYDQRGMPLHIVQTSSKGQDTQDAQGLDVPHHSVETQSDAAHLASDQLSLAVGSECEQQSTAEVSDPGAAAPKPGTEGHQQLTQLARLPSAKGHGLSSWPIAGLFGKAQSPIKHPSTPGDLLGNLPASSLLSVKTVSMHQHRPSTAASASDARTTNGAIPTLEDAQGKDCSESSSPSGIRQSVVCQRSTASGCQQALLEPDAAFRTEVHGRADSPWPDTQYSKDAMLRSDSSLDQPDSSTADSWRQTTVEQLPASRQAAGVSSGSWRATAEQTQSFLQPGDLVPPVDNGNTPPATASRDFAVNCDTCTTVVYLYLCCLQVMA